MPVPFSETARSCAGATIPTVKQVQMGTLGVHTIYLLGSISVQDVAPSRWVLAGVIPALFLTTVPSCAWERTTMGKWVTEQVGPKTTTTKLRLSISILVQVVPLLRWPAVMSIRVAFSITVP